MSDSEIDKPEGKLQKGIEVTKEAIAARDVGALKKCIDQFMKLKAPMDKIYEAIISVNVSYLTVYAHN